MRRLSDVPWTSRRPPSSPSCQRWHTCGRRRAPRCRRKTSNLFSTNLNSAYLTPSACAVMLVPCAWLLAAMIRNVPNRRTSRCWNMMLMVATTCWLERDLWIDGQRPNEPADSLKQIIRFLLFFCFDLPSSSPQDQWCWWSQRGSPHSRDQRSRPVSGKKVLYKIYLLHKFLCFCTIHHSIWPILYGEFLMLRRAITFLKNFLITLAIVLRE